MLNKMPFLDIPLNTIFVLVHNVYIRTPRNICMKQQHERSPSQRALVMDALVSSSVVASKYKLGNFGTVKTIGDPDQDYNLIVGVEN